MSTIWEYSNSTLLLLLRRLEDVAQDNDAGLCRQGICGQVAPLQFEEKSCLRAIFQRWPESSGYADYPVPCEGMDPGNAYRGSRYRWGDHEYGRKRRELLDFCIAELRKRLVTQS